MRSAVALLLGPHVGKDESVKRFCRGTVALHPTRPKYSSTWDPKLVLDHIAGWIPNDTISLKRLSEKLAVLMALTTAHRMQTLTSILIDNIIHKTDRIEIKVPAILKTSGPKRPQPNLILPFFPENSAICVASTLQSYLERTRPLRGTEKALFISGKKPHNAITSQTLSHWIKDVLSKSGVDTATFSAYSTRHASTSAAKDSGVNIDMILKTAGWTPSSETFARFYNRPIQEDPKTFASSILRR
ncbi:uncharacterized protein LOC107044738 [Diachasma alloeum]|uniref:uncharacterized protein LOC107044738 n=1 Tax=Diachasma alloeum TaxID=454923 RepID=UPI0007383808|nr:uncharacterized protein LOC107044738 [Diachasma alloeum]XP_015122236.1 uncharacterized protein LOC107044738 [Diachasma alloeum]